MLRVGVDGILRIGVHQEILLIFSSSYLSEDLDEL